MAFHVDECPHHWRNLGKGSAVPAECACESLPLRRRVEVTLRRHESADTLDRAEARLESMALFGELARAWLP